jgi:hypothetical protein
MMTTARRHVLIHHINPIATGMTSWYIFHGPLSRGHVSGVIFKKTVSGAIRPGVHHVPAHQRPDLYTSVNNACFHDESLMVPRKFFRWELFLKRMAWVRWWSKPREAEVLWWVSSCLFLTVEHLPRTTVRQTSQRPGYEISIDASQQYGCRRVFG